MIKNKLRSINVHFWDDTYIIRLNQKEKLLFLYLLTNSLCNLIGVYEITSHRICFDTGLEPDDVSAILKKFEQDDKIIFTGGYIILINFVKNQTYNKNMFTGALSLYESRPNHIRLILYSLQSFETLSNHFESYESAPNALNTLELFPNQSKFLETVRNSSEPFETLSNRSKPLFFSENKKIIIRKVEVEVEDEVEIKKKLKLNGKLTLSEVKTLFEKEGFEEYEAVKFFEHNKAQNWMNNGKPVDWLFCANAWMKQIKKSAIKFKSQ
ncbi:MAG: hypothetical protein NTV87_12950 [Ignavibacteriae bacterium]|nr:hypothetical protein [Ignavibacteriota bacterium]